MTIKSEIQTSLGPTLTPNQNGEWEIDLSQVRIFFGLSILSKTLAEEIGNSLHSTPGDVSFLYRINPNINHELIDMHIQYVQVYARAGVLNDWIIYRSQFEDDLRVVLGTFQRQSIARKIHPEFYGESSRSSSSLGLLFPFYELDQQTSVNYLILMERVSNPSTAGEFFLRITIDSSSEPMLNLGSIAHYRVDEITSRTYIAGLSKISESLSNQIMIAAQKGETFFEEENRHFSKVFEQIAKTPFGNLTHINFYWDDQFRRFLSGATLESLLPMMKKLFLIMEDTDIASLIKEGSTLCVKLGRVDVFVDLSRLDRVLNFSFNKRRTQINSSFYLRRMVQLESLANQKAHSFDFENTHIFLIHHITSEIVSLIEAFRRLKAKSLDVAFVKYGGKIPPAYLDVLLDIPTEQFYMAGLELKLTQNKKVYYAVSSLYSDFSKHSHFKEKLEEAKFSFYDAMRYLATYLFLDKLFRFTKGQDHIILIEDGGYIAPLLNQRMAENKSLKEFCDEFWIKCPKEYESESLQNFILARVIGTVEHTRNGYDRMQKVLQNQMPLSLPCYSIAISNEKTKEESKEVAHSMLNAIENSLHGLGKVLSKRKILLLGAKGNIGSFLESYLKKGRLHESNQEIVLVDKKYSATEAMAFDSFERVPKQDLLTIDLVIGVTGESILKKESLETWILESKHNDLFLASGSTKTVEFQDLIHWFNEISAEDTWFSIQDLSFQCTMERLLDPQTQMDLGARFIFKTDPNAKTQIEKSIYLLSDGSPINFLFYGVPTESMDPIISQLAMASLGMVSQFKKKALPKPNLYAVDHQINIWGEPK
ncbi:hypothetical protein LPTSP4_30280 [Leptospira ryugenii]|uniref:Uncharacterized protein n=1 Tax=Leptospira ryugenii TaxID=1917863 RepID=A0A2P2E3L7_9LEPT|nr:hypothetical protein [Leptospira ryugenii]GBF51490.1 hypothetical protein LPTSP4_30280 [Leptospira ryugenii]